jgi:hypothetical protein
MAAVETATETEHANGKESVGNNTQKTEEATVDGNEDPGPCSCCGKV